MEQITQFIPAVSVWATSNKEIAARDRVLSALNFLIGEGITYHPTSINDEAIQALIEDYFNNRSDTSDDESDHSSDKGFPVL